MCAYIRSDIHIYTCIYTQISPGSEEQEHCGVYHDKGCHHSHIT